MQITFSCTIKELSPLDIEALQNCLTYAYNEFKTKEVFIQPSLEYVQKIILGYGKSAGIYIDGKLVGFASIVFPGKGKHNLGYLLRFSPDKLMSVVQLEHIYILPQYRGKGFAKKLISFLITSEVTYHETMLCTISPLNKRSLSTAFSLNEIIVSLATIYSAQRFILSLDLSSSQHLYYPEAIELPINNLVLIHHALCIGYVGVSFGTTTSTLILKRKITL